MSTWYQSLSLFFSKPPLFPASQLFIVLSSMASPPSPSLAQAHHYLSIKLTSKIFVHWKTHIESFLQAQNLLQYLDGSLPRPVAGSAPTITQPTQVTATSPITTTTLATTTPTTQATTTSLPTPTTSADLAALQAWDQQDALLRSLLISSLSEEVFPVVVGKPTSRDIWEALHHSFASSSTSRVLSLHLALQDLTHHPGESVSVFLRRAKSIADELTLTGHPIFVADFNLHVFRSLRSDFREIVPMLMGSTTPLPYYELHSRLVSHEFLHASQLRKLSLHDSVSQAPPTSASPPQGASTPAAFSTTSCKELDKYYYC